VKNWGTNPHKDSVLKKLLLELYNSRRVRILETSLDKLAILTNDVKGTKQAL